MQVSWANTSLADTIRGATEPYDSQGVVVFRSMAVTLESRPVPSSRWR
jgi:hypothetical protein